MTDTSFSTPLFPKREPHDWLLWRDGAHAPAFNMAADHVLLDRVAAWGQPLLRLYAWDRPSFSFGRSQRFPDAIPSGTTVVRRPTGGGGVGHDAECTYALILPAAHPLSKLDIPESYRLIHSAILAQLGGSVRLAEAKTTADPLTMQCFVSPTRFDILGPDGSKQAGAAQLRRRGASLTQGSVRLEVAGGDRAALQHAILQAFACAAGVRYVEWEPDDDFLSLVETRARIQYATEAWNRDGVPGPSEQQRGGQHG